MKYFLDRIAAHLLAGYGDCLETQCMVFPNRRAGLYFMKYLSARAGRPVWSPGIRTINDLFGMQSPLRIAANETLIIRLYNVYRELVPSAGSFDEFYFWGDMLLNDFDDVDKYMVEAGRLYKNLSDLRRIDAEFGSLSEEQLSAVRQFWINFNAGSSTREKDDFIGIWSILPALYEKFRASLHSEGLAYEGMIFRDVAERCLNGDMPPMRWERFHFTGFNALNKCEEILMQQLKKKGLASFYWDYDESYIRTGSGHSAGFFIMNNLRMFGNDMPSDWSYKTGLTNYGNQSKFRIISTSSDIGQAKLVPGILEQMGETGSEEAHHTAIVLADENLLVPLLSTIPDSYTDVNITMGYPLKYSQVCSLVSNLLSLLRNCRSENGEDYFAYRDVFNVLNSRWVSVTAKEESQMLLKEIRKDRIIWISLQKLQKGTFLNRLFRKIVTPEELPDYLRNILAEVYIIESEDETALTDPGIEEINFHNELVYKIIQVINRLDRVIRESAVQLSLVTWSRLFDRILRSMSIPFSGEPLAGIQIMGILETRSLDFRNVIMLSVNEGTLPQSSAGSSYIPYSLREAFGLPTIRHQDSIYAYYFYRILHRADNVTFVYNSNSEGLRTGEMSRLLLQLIYLGRNKPSLQSVGYDVFPNIRVPDTVKRNLTHVRKLEELFMKPGEKPLSPSAVNAWLNCRMLFYYRYICGIREQEKVTGGIDPALFGQILHGIMEKLYTPLMGKDLNRKNLEPVYNNHGILERTIRTVLESNYFPGRSSGNDGESIITSEILLAYVRMILKRDMETVSFRLAGLEKWVSAVMSISYKNRRTDVYTGGIIDRMDRSGGLLRILDYKTGNVAMEIRSVEDLFDESAAERSDAWLQMFMYCELYLRNEEKERIYPSIYAVRELNDPGFLGRLEIRPGKDQGYEVEDYAAVRSQFAVLLQTTLESVFDPGQDFTMTDNTDRCRYCPYSELCRR